LTILKNTTLGIDPKLDFDYDPVSDNILKQLIPEKMKSMWDDILNISVSLPN
jgi:hypothetical protein